MRKIGNFQKKHNKAKLTLVVSRGRTLHRIDDDIWLDYRIKRLANSSKNN